MWLFKNFLNILALAFMAPILLALGAVLYAAAYGFIIFFGGWIMMYFFL
jgi:hypothetical protein